MPHRNADDVRQARSLCALFQSAVAAHGDRVAVRAADGSSSYTWNQYDARVRQIAAGLAALGVGRGDTVGLMLSNRPEFNIIDAAVMHLGAIPFSVYPTSSSEQVAYLFSNAENRVVVCEEQFLPRVEVASRETKAEHIVCVDGGRAGHMTLDELANAAEPDFDFDAAWRAVEPDDVVTLIYTSGTTGPPKGVELTHAGLQSNLAALLELAEVSADDRVVSYLPDAHIVNRFMAHYAPMVWGFSVTTLADPKKLVATLPEVRPTLFVAVPMLWYKVKAALEKALAEQTGVRGKLADWAVSAGRRRGSAVISGKPVPLWLAAEASLADRLVLTKLRARLGLDQMKVAVTGAAPIAPEALEFVVGIGLPVCEAWGMSETSALATVNRPDAIRIGTVGQAAPSVEIRVADDGELLVRGPAVMRGYRGDPEMTAEAVDAEGWMHTGDIGSIDDAGYIRIVDRKKELIINSGGKNMSPANIENHVTTACPLIGSVVAIGDNRPFVVALVTLDPDAAADFAKEHGIGAAPAELADHPDVKAAIQVGVDAANQKLSRVEQIKYAEILPAFWEPGSDELTPTMKLKRKVIREKYAEEIDRIYANAQRPGNA